MILIKNIKLEQDSIQLLESKLKKVLKLEKFEYEIYRKSIDARNSITFNYQVIIKENISEKKLSKIKDAVFYEEPNFEISLPHKKSKTVIVGSGPAGLFCGYILSKYDCDVMIIERGEQIEDRIKSIDSFLNGKELNINSNIQFGEGGAGTFSDGKLTARSKDIRVREVLKIFVENGAPQDILYDAKPHIGTDILRKVIVNMRNFILKNGGEFEFNTVFSDICIENAKVKNIIAKDKKMYADNYVLALGNSSRDTFYMLSKKIKMKNKPFAVGFRIEHLQKNINFSQYKCENESLPAASYMLTYNDKNLGLSGYTFCMCPGGYVINASSERGMLCVNGMSYHKRNGENANSALIVTVDESIYGTELLAGMEFQKRIEKRAFELGGSNYFAPIQKIADYLENRATTKLGLVKPTIKPGYTLSNLRGIYPDIVDEVISNSIINMDRKLKGFAISDGILTGVETRSSSPVRILRDENLKAEGIMNLYPIGEGSGYSGGIVSSAIDGIKAAEKIIRGE
ncbi:NAD(P)/FAD-dependent oxidoreductase [Peptoniphilus sp. oral taxon 386]|uniref:NAD(P)/FAD-dependent oxidoreductase n=1 Tax=Peptoniphilus sp. oral taxon 386 TaxID=652713 RepID=UPI0001DA9A68|nr:NAD(P)-binding protein [Peptoniphilus sp. oral taxon 386]EFI41922.1 FAD dependent oxidoreductase [Peptoniphilus sp. oral taxon 386 str. F0131]